MDVLSLEAMCRLRSGEGELAVSDPATGEKIASLQLAGQKAIIAAIDECEVAFQAWRQESSERRSELLRTVASMMRRDIKDLSRLLTSEQGKSLKEAEGEIEYAASYLDWFAEEARRISGSISSLSQEKDIIVRKEPIGVCAAITPWNFPSAMVTRKAGAAIAAGCSVILKPAPDTPLSAVAIQRLFEEAGAPKGLLNVVVCEADLFSDIISSDLRIRKLSFTGSTRTGKLLMAKASNSLLKLTMELGGNAAFIVCEDASLDQALAGAMFSKFRNGGQACVSINRFLIHSSRYEEFSSLLAKKVAALRVGAGTDPATQVAPLINLNAVKKIHELVADALENGAKLKVGTLPDPNSLYVAPIVLCDVTPSMRIASEEIFGPVCALYRFDRDEEALTFANRTQYGLANYVFTKNLDRARYFIGRLESGIVGVNDSRISIYQAPFGGCKQSGFGKEGGREGIEEYLISKYVLLS